MVDNGIGIPKGQEDRIFRVFERLAEVGAAGSPKPLKTFLGLDPFKP